MNDLHLALGEVLDKVLRLWKTPMRVTLVVRDPANPQNEVVIGDDSLDAAIAAVERAKARPPVRN